MYKAYSEYFKVLSPEFPEWLEEYINTPALLKQQYISITCGTIYSDLFKSKTFFSSLDHSIAVALIIWHFTGDKKQTLAGLFHDIATPAFKHCIDFLNGDYMVQESTEDLTTQIIKNSKEIMALLKRDGIELCDVNDYHKYPIADNDTPRLSADRLEYSFANAVFTYNLASLDEVKEFYDDIKVGRNEDGVEELAFCTKALAEKFVTLTTKLSAIYMADKTRYSMQFIADIIKKLNKEGKITKADLYELKESEVIEMIKNSQYKDIYNIWCKAKRVKVSNIAPCGVYYVHHGTKVRYIDLLVNEALDAGSACASRCGRDGTSGASSACQRISSLSPHSKKAIQKILDFDMSGYVYLDLSF